MNSEELELSLRNEFESYLNNVLAEMKQEVSDFQEKFQAEFDKHKSQIDDVFKDFAERVNQTREIDAAFKDSVVEHLRLSRDEGARITASAIAEAEELEKETPAPAPTIGFSEIRDAISDISSQDSQSAILKSLVNNAAQFTARGAFFIIKNEHFVGWRVFGNEADMDEHSVREIFFPMANETLLSESVRSLSAVESSYGTYADDSLYLNKLEFGQPEKMYAIPLVARGRGVAVLYADYGTEGADVNVEALETLVRVAGLTVELLAAAQSSKQIKEETSAVPAEEAAETDKPEEETATETTPNYHAVSSYDFGRNENSEQENTQEFSDENNAYDVPVAEDSSYAEFKTADEPTEAETISNEFEYQPVTEDAQAETAEAEDEFQPQVVEETENVNNYEFVSEERAETVEAEDTETVEEVQEPVEAVEEKETEPVYSWNQPIDSFESVSETVETQEETSFGVAEEVETVETPVEAEEDFTTAPTEDFAAVPVSEYTFESSRSFETEPQTEEVAPVAETPQFNQWESNSYQETSYDNSRFETVETPVETQFETFEPTNGNSESFAAEPAVAVSEPIAAPPVKTRFSERNVDLPIEVAEEERRSHNDARRFARLLVSEIKLYNEQKVKEGRDSRDLYDRLREAIDRSREMYDKRVQPPVSSKFDYFHYELVSNLAEGDASKLGTSYPGATI